MYKSPEELRAEFDEVARRFEKGDADEEGRRFRFMPIKGFIAGRLPAQGDLALEIGCGLGTLTIELARRFKKAIALDLSPEMIRMARANTREFNNIEFIVADVNEWDFPVGECDCVASITTLHHLPLEPTLVKMREALKPGGLLLVGDFYSAEGLQKWMEDLRAVWRSARRKLRGSRQWSRPGGRPNVGHDPNERYLTLSEARRAYASLLPGASLEIIAKTYALEWKKP